VANHYITDKLKKQMIDRSKARERFDGHDAPTCKEFGCGKILTPTEYLFSEYCFVHARKNNLSNQNLPDNELDKI